MWDEVVYPSYLLDNILPRFAQLEHLELCEYSFSPDRLHPILRSFPSLTSLPFGPASPVTDALLLSLVNPVTQLPSLRHLTLDYVENLRGPTLTEAGFDLSSQASETEGDIWPGWEPPCWNAFCEPDGLESVLQTAESSEIEVDGTAVGTESWHADERLQRYACTMTWCYEQWRRGEGRFEDALRDYGDEDVRDWLHNAVDDSGAVKELFETK